MFQGAAGVSVEWPAVLYPAALPQYENVSPLKPTDPPKSPEQPKDAAAPGKAFGVRQTGCIHLSSTDTRISVQGLVFIRV